MSNKDYGNPLDMLYQIVNDLWPDVKRTSEAAQSPEKAAPAVPAKPAGGGVTGFDALSNPLRGYGSRPGAVPYSYTGLQPKPQPAAPVQPHEKVAPQTPPFEEFWRRADERIDWTGALIHEDPVDGETPVERWHFLHEHAARVLSGDISAYAEVLQYTDPLSDLTPYAEKMTVSAPSADEAVVGFDALPERLATPVQDRRLLAGLALRCARDVLALLPVKKVTVRASLPNGTSLTVTYPYGSLRKAQFGFIDPVEYAEQMGCIFEEAPAETEESVPSGEDGGNTEN